MDLKRIIEELRAERDSLSGTIEVLERLLQNGGATEKTKRRGRKFMADRDREEVSKRMKRYWASRRKPESAKAAAPSDYPNQLNHLATEHSWDSPPKTSTAGAN